MIVDSVVQFFPRGGSAYVVAYVARQMAARGVVSRVLCGTLGDPGDFSHAESFYAGLPTAAMDYNPAAAAHQCGEPSMDGQSQPFHPSYEDRGPTAPDRMFTAVPRSTLTHITNAWTAHLTAFRSPCTDVVHLHHLSHLQQAAARAYPGVPRLTTLHGTDLKLLDQAATLTALAHALDEPLARLAQLPPPGTPGRDSAITTLLRRATSLTEDQRTLLIQSDWRLWRHTESWLTAVRRSLPLAGRIVAVSESDRTEIHRLLGVPEHDITVVPNGVDTARFIPQHLGDHAKLAHLRRWLVDDPRGWLPDSAPGTIRYTEADLDRLTSPDGRLRPIVMWVGRYQRNKRINILMEAFAAARAKTSTNPALVLWGGAPGECEGEHPLHTAQRLGIADDTYLLGYRGHDELPDGLNCADLMVAPSVWESFGMVYIEAAACGTAPVAAHIGGPLDILTTAGEHANGWTARPDDATDLARVIADALNNPAERARRAANAAAHVHRTYSWATVTDAYLDLYRQTART
ncbi:glycosyltransferase [Streptomyces sp. NPDC005722]